jgi:hypothetical protein
MKPVSTNLGMLQSNQSSQRRYSVVPPALTTMQL